MKACRLILLAVLANLSMAFAQENTPVDPFQPNHTKAVQSSDPAAVQMTATILHMIETDPSLSFAAKNVKVVTTDKSKVVLHGVVKSLQESTRIEGFALKAGAKKVSNKLAVE